MAATAKTPATETVEIKNWLTGAVLFSAVCIVISGTYWPEGEAWDQWWLPLWQLVDPGGQTPPPYPGPFTP